jgi:hypothetical protein
MKRFLFFLLSLLILPALVGWGSFTNLHSTNMPTLGSTLWIKKEIHALHAQTQNLDLRVLEAGLRAYLKARAIGKDSKGVLTIIDYSKPSTARRLWVIDVIHNRVLFNTWVAHGRNSGKVAATNFSNENGSLKSSLGVFITTSEAYMGGNGYSLRIKGVEPGINDNAYRRDIVFHGAWYATGDVAEKYGQLGRSWGCPAVSKKVARPLIDTIRDDTVVLAWYPDSKWLRQSDWVT